MLMVDGEEYQGEIIKCRVCGKDMEVKTWEVGKRVLCGSELCKRVDVRNRMRESRKRRKESCDGCEVLGGISHG